MEDAQYITPEKQLDYRPKTAKIALLACGALAKEIIAIMRMNNLNHLALYCLPAIYHNTPEKIIPSLSEKISTLQDDFDNFIIAYGDCGTGGQIDKFCDDNGYQRISGPHGYSFFAGHDIFDNFAK